MKKVREKMLFSSFLGGRIKQKGYYTNSGKLGLVTGDNCSVQGHYTIKLTLRH